MLASKIISLREVMLLIGGMVMDFFIDDSAIERVDKSCKKYKEIYGR